VIDELCIKRLCIYIAIITSIILISQINTMVRPSNRQQLSSYSCLKEGRHLNCSVLCCVVIVILVVIVFLMTGDLGFVSFNASCLLHLARRVSVKICVLLNILCIV